MSSIFTTFLQSFSLSSTSNSLLTYSPAFVVLLTATICLEPRRIIGSGSFGYVFEAYDKTHKQTVAVKRTTKAGEYVSREFEVLDKLKDCKNVVKMLDIYYSKNEEGKTAQNIIFEFCKFNLEELIQKNKE